MARKALLVKNSRRSKNVSRRISLGVKPVHPTKVYNRCELCGKVRGYMRKFKICRICFRELASQGKIMGVRKSSW